MTSPETRTPGSIGPEAGQAGEISFDALQAEEVGMLEVPADLQGSDAGAGIERTAGVWTAETAVAFDSVAAGEDGTEAQAAAARGRAAWGERAAARGVDAQATA